MINYNAKIVHQGIDFFVIDYFFKDVVLYELKFITFLEKLSILKEKAKNIDSFGIKFVKAEIIRGFGDWFVSSRGNGRFKFYVENQDYRLFVSTAKINSELPQIRVEIPAKTIFRLGIKKAIRVFERLILKLTGKRFIRKLNRIDLATDVWGIMYELDDIYKFQTRMGEASFFDIETKNFNGTYLRFNKIQGIQFGKGDKLFRIYDKTKKINISPNESYIKYKWEYNGYDEEKGFPVFRHEIQYRRGELKKFIPIDCKDEIDYFLEHLGNLWAKALNYVEYVPLNENEKELQRIKKPLIKTDTRRQIFYRAKNDSHRFNLWKFIFKWDNEKFKPIEKFRYVKNFSLDYLKKQFKGFITAYYKVFGGDLTHLKDVITAVEEDLKKQGIDLHIYGLSKLASSFVENYESILISGEFIPHKQYENVAGAYEDFIGVLKTINNRDYLRPIKKVVNLI